MNCLNVKISLSNDRPIPIVKDIVLHPQIRCSLVCGVDFGKPSFTWSQGVRLVWDNGGLVLLDSE